MRIMSDKIRLVVADEPTSAMDPLGEFELFEKLRASRSGKTMVFVTHRFGHLTKHADLVLYVECLDIMRFVHLSLTPGHSRCMKDGQLVEQGTHRELIKKNGEYCRLYNIQASAFSS